MREISVYHVDAFTTEKFRGNTAGVVLDAERLSEDEMQSIAKEFRNPYFYCLQLTRNMIIK